LFPYLGPCFRGDFGFGKTVYTQREEDYGGEVERFYIDEAMERDETGLV